MLLECRMMQLLLRASSSSTLILLYSRLLEKSVLIDFVSWNSRINFIKIWTSAFPLCTFEVWLRSHNTIEKYSRRTMFDRFIFNEACAYVSNAYNVVNGLLVIHDASQMNKNQFHHKSQQ